MKKNANDSGFTLVELLIVISITGLLASFLITYSNIGRNQVTLSIETAKIAQLILRAKSLSIATFNRAVPSCGYGVHFDYAAKMYELFSYEPGSCSNINQSDPSFRVVLQTFTLNPGLNFRNGANNLYDVLFMPPAPKTLISTDPSGIFGDAIGKIYVKTVDGSETLTIEVQSGGQVNF